MTLDEDLIEAEILVKRWKISLDTLNKWRLSRKGPPFLKFGRQIFYRIPDVMAFEVQLAQASVIPLNDNDSEPDFKRIGKSLKRDFKKGSPRLEIVYNRIKEENKRRAK